MKIKSSTLLLILLFSMIPTVIPVVITINAPFLHGTGVVKEQVFAPLDTEPLQANSMPELLPFWTDIVDAEVVPNDGEGVYIAVLDTGLLPVAPWVLSQANVRYDLGIGFTHEVTWNSGINDFDWGGLETRSYWTDPWGSGHGTHVTSIITGYNYGDFWIRGVAPEATIIPILVLDYWWLDCPDPNYPNCHDGKVLFRGGTWEMIAAGIYYAADLVQELDAPLIISMSLGGPTPSPMIEAAIDYAISKGVIIVASAGNSGYAGMGWPGAFPQVISVAAGGWTENWVPVFNTGFWLNDVPEDLKTPDYWGNNWQLYLEDFSSRPNKDRGQKSFHLDVCAPGAAVVGPHQRYVYWNGVEWVLDIPRYYYVWGTSQAAPCVSGIAAHVLQSHPDVDQGSMEKILKNAAHGLPLPCDGSWVFDPWYGLYHFEWYGTDYGAGWLQADAALKSAAKFA